jgi:ribosomal protein S18 acetylase RimI-like enzyme
MILFLACVSVFVTSQNIPGEQKAQAEKVYPRPFKIEEASLHSDLDRIADTINFAYKRQPFNREDSSRITASKLRTLLLDGENKLYLAVSGGDEICGTVLSHQSEISLLSVHPDYQGHGLGLQLLQHAEEEAFKIYESVFLKVIPLFQENLIHYYESAGYKSFGEHESLSQEKYHRIQEQYHTKVYALIMRKENLNMKQ